MNNYQALKNVHVIKKFIFMKMINIFEIIVLFKYIIYFLKSCIYKNIYVNLELEEYI